MEPIRASARVPATSNDGGIAGSGGYTAWCRRIVEQAGRRADIRLLFDNSIDEPTALLQEHVRRCFAGPLDPRYRSTFAHGNPFVLDALAARYGVDRDMITCTTGASSGIAVVFKALLAPGGRVLVERPNFDFLPDLAASHGVAVDYLERSAPDFSITPEQLRAGLHPQTRLIVLTNLHNPSGAWLDDRRLRALAEVAEAAGIPILIDEVYGDFVPRSLRSGPAARLSPAFISVNSLTKVYGLFALKCGWIIASGALRERINAVYDRFEFGLSKLTHAVAASLLEDSAALDAHWRGLLEKARPLLLESVGRLERDGLISGAVPEHGCTYFPRLHAGDDVSVADWLWRERRLAVAPGTYFGMPGHLRLGFGRDAGVLAESLLQLEEGLRGYRDERADAAAETRR